MNDILFLTGIKKIIKSFDNYLIDLWGVIHNGIECNYDAIKVLENLKKNIKKKNNTYFKRSKTSLRSSKIFKKN